MNDVDGNAVDDVVENAVNDADENDNDEDDDLGLEDDGQVCLNFRVVINSQGRCYTLVCCLSIILVLLILIMTVKIIKGI